MIDYTLDQLFIHLDDPDVRVQESVFKVIMVATAIDRELVLKKAEANRLFHRSPAQCDRVLAEARGYEILSS